MTDLSGRDVGGYRLLSLLGKGGMGEVYRAHDPTLGRDVAIKVLPPSLSTNAERMARFEREARLLAALNHPHIGAIYGIAETDGVRGLVLELVEGDTLRERIAFGLTRREALTIASQIADALDLAHEKWIVHRDLKPDNVKVAPDGAVKVLDFGIAKMSGIEDGGSAPTLTLGPGTLDGIVMGTAAFMSPEQARGKSVDKRADIWAFGCVLKLRIGLRFVDGQGRLTFTNIPFKPLSNGLVAWAPDGRRIAMVSIPTNAPAAIWIVEPAAPTPFKLLMTLKPNQRPRGLTWTTDGARLIIASEESLSDLVLHELER